MAGRPGGGKPLVGGWVTVIGLRAGQLYPLSVGDDGRDEEQEAR